MERMSLLIGGFKVLLSFIFSLKSWKKRLILICFDSISIPMSVLLALGARLEHHQFLAEADTYYACAVALFITMAIFIRRGIYKSIVRHVSLDTAITIISASTLAGISLLGLIVLGELRVPRSVPFIQVAFSIIFMSSFRFFIRAAGQNINRDTYTNISIYGAGKAGRQLFEALKWDNSYRVCQIIDDDPNLSGHSISGIIVEQFDAAVKKFKTHEIDTVLLAMPSSSPQAEKQILELLEDTEVKVKSIPDLASLISGTSKITELHDIDIEYLLGRVAVKPIQQLMARTIKDKIVLVTGAGGSIGSELCRQALTQNPAVLIALDVSEFNVYKLVEELNIENLTCDVIPAVGSVTDKKLIQNILKKYKVTTIFHAAAYKHVPLMELNATQCMANNVLGTENLASLAVDAKVADFTLISSDKAVNSANFMGASKRFAELICQDFSARQHSTTFSIVRFGNVLGSSGSVVPQFKKQILNGGPVTVTHEDVNRYFMTIPEAAQLVIQASAIPEKNRIFILEMGEPVKILDLAKKMITLSGKKFVVGERRPLALNEILITITGLRRGEKMFEELSYGQTLKQTMHPRIQTSVETRLPSIDMARLLERLRDAIRRDDVEQLRKLIAKIGITLDK